MKNNEDLKNEKGVIAESYSNLQSIPALELARSAFPVPGTSHESTVKAIFQAFEIGMLNLNDLLSGMANDLDNGKPDKASVKVGWYRDLVGLLVHVTNNLSLFSFSDSEGFSGLNFNEISSLPELAENLSKFDRTFSNYLAGNHISLDEIIGSRSLDDDLMRIVHFMRVSNYELTILEKNLAGALVPMKPGNYEEFIGIAHLSAAVREMRLKGDTFFTQFRGIHQIPEILTTELNDYLEETIRCLREGRKERAVYHLRIGNLLMESVVASLSPIANNLTTSDYHEIRENLGLTSGSHSVNIHYHLFRDLYQQAGRVFVETFFSERTVYLESISNDFLLKTLEVELLRLSNLTSGWRKMHIHLPRNNVGGNLTKSLIGSSDAVEAVKKMQAAAAHSDPLNPIKELYESDKSKRGSILTDYLKSEGSLDSIILEKTGEITQKRFAHVQNRSGIFAKGAPFIPPEKREA